MIVIGIDTGTKTGLAVMRDGTLTQLETCGIITAMYKVLEYRSRFADDLVVCIEDARLRKWLPKNVGKERLKGAGSVSRDAAIWQEWCEYHGLPYILVAPASLQGLTKRTEKDFRQITGWHGKRCSEHARDAGLMVWKYERLIRQGVVAIK